MSPSEPNLPEAIERVVRVTRELLDWMPHYAKSSSGYMRRVAVEKALENLEGALGLAQL